MTLTKELCNNPRIKKIASFNMKLANQIVQQGGFLNSDQVAQIAKIDRGMLLLIRCGCGRMMVPAQDVLHFANIITEHAKLKQEKTGEEFSGDYIRDISVPV